jgi:hypothetical protein
MQRGNGLDQTQKDPGGGLAAWRKIGHHGTSRLA